MSFLPTYATEGGGEGFHAEILSSNVLTPFDPNLTYTY